MLGVLTSTGAPTETVPLNLIEVILAQGSWFRGAAMAAPGLAALP